MNNSWQNLDIKTCSDKELMSWLRQVSPIVSVFIQACQRLFENEELDSSPCQNCDKAHLCTDPCDLLESQLPGIYEGSAILNHSSGNLIDQMPTQAISSVPSQFETYQNCRFLFNDYQWEIIQMRFQQGMTLESIANRMDKAVNTIWKRLKTIEKLQEGYFRKMRKDLL